MARLFSSIRIAPGVRLSTTRRGLRAHVGPRGLRVHAGGGRTGVSTGAGPVTVYQSVGRSNRRTTRGRAPAATTAAGDAAALTAVLDELWSLHRQEFRGASRGVAPAPMLPPFPLLLARFERRELKGVWPFDRDSRRAARLRARAEAEQWALDLLDRAPRDRAAAQHAIDEHWDRLMTNDPAMTMVAIAGSIAEARAPVEAVGVHDDEAWLVVHGPPDADLPVRKPAVTSAGAPTTRPMSLTDRWAVIRQVIAARALLAAKQAFAAAPGIATARVVVLGPLGDALLGATISRGDLMLADFREDAWTVLQRVDPRLVVRVRGRTRALEAVDLPAAYSMVLADAR